MDLSIAQHCLKTVLILFLGSGGPWDSKSAAASCLEGVSGCQGVYASAFSGSEIACTKIKAT
jgi:hypothetical protein